MSIKDFLISCIFPKRCAICDEVINYNDEVCNCCVAEFPANSSVRCIPYAESDEVYRCFSPFIYRGKLREVLLRFKFHNHTKCVNFFSREIAKKLCSSCDVSTVDYICFVPMTEKSTLERGYNQSEILAKSLGKCMGIPVKDVLSKVRETPVQHSLSAKARERNLFSSFSLREGTEVKNKNFILCDDIITTGSTLKECLRVLKNGGADNVICCTIAASAGTDFRI